MGRPDRAGLQVRAARGDGGRPARGIGAAAPGRSGTRMTDTAAGRPHSVPAALKRALAFVLEERRLFFTGCIFVALSIGTGLTYPLVIRWIIDDGVQAGRLDLLNRLSLAMLGILVVEAIATLSRDYCFKPRAQRGAARLPRAPLPPPLPPGLQ